MVPLDTSSSAQAQPPRGARTVVLLGMLCATLAAILLVFPDEVAMRAALVFASGLLAARVVADEAPRWRTSRRTWLTVVGDVVGAILAAGIRLPRGVRFVLVVALVGASRAAMDTPPAMMSGLVVAGAFSAPLLRSWGG